MQLLFKKHPNSHIKTVGQDSPSYFFFGVPWELLVNLCIRAYASVVHCASRECSFPISVLFLLHWYLYMGFSWIALFMHPCCSRQRTGKASQGPSALPLCLPVTADWRYQGLLCSPGAIAKKAMRQQAMADVPVTCVPLCLCPCVRACVHCKELVVCPPQTGWAMFVMPVNDDVFSFLL